MLKPLATARRESRVKVLVGTRRGARGELLSALGPQKRVIDLDTPEYLERETSSSPCGGGCCATASPARVRRIARNQRSPRGLRRRSPIAPGAVRAVAVGALDGRPIAVSGGDDATMRVWDLAAGAQLGEPLSGHTGGVWAVAVGALDGRPIAVSGGTDGTLRVWNLAGSELAVINVGSPVHATGVRGSTIVVGARAGVMATDVRGAARVG